MRVGTKKIEIILNSYTSVRKRPVNYDEMNRLNFYKEFKRKIEEVKLYHFSNAYITDLGRVIHNYGLIKDSDIWELDKYSEYKYVLSSILKKRNNQNKGIQFLHIINSNWKGYFHWITECLPRLFIMKDKIKEYTLLLPNDLSEYQKKTLEPFNLEKTAHIQSNELNYIPNLIMPSHLARSGNYYNKVIADFSEFMTNHFGRNSANSSSKRKIYISRKKAPRRKIINEEEVERLFKNYGFECICMEDYCFEEQVLLCSECETIASMHGAGLTNMLFMPKGGKILEFRHSDDTIRNCYFTLASELSHSYYYLICHKDNEEETPTTANAIINISKLESVLKNMV